MRKTAASLDAIRWWREGRILEIAEYCCFDVKVTRLVHEHGCRHKELFFHDRFARRQRVESIGSCKTGLGLSRNAGVPPARRLNGRRTPADPTGETPATTSIGRQ